MRTHSAGPWKRRRIGTTGDGQNRDHDIYVVESDKGHEIVSGLREMDARLIAAAPDLLDALTSLRDRLRECAKIPATAADAYDSFYSEIVDDAIAAATGAA